MRDNVRLTRTKIKAIFQESWMFTLKCKLNQCNLFHLHGIALIQHKLKISTPLVPEVA
eukprot:c19151_g1_i1 orf=414-587(-)